MTAQLAGSPVVAVTGGARGIGKATAQAFVAAGARVAIGDIDDDAARATAREIGGGTVATRLDVSDEESFAAFLAFTESRFGPLTVLVNNAGIMPTGPFLSETAALSRKQLDINVMGCLNGMRTALPGMLERRAGHIVNVASIAGRSAVPGGLTYAATKAAVISSTESACAEFDGRGVNFTCVLPSFTDTDLISGLRGARGVKNAKPAHVASAILSAVVEPRELVYIPPSLAAAARIDPLLPRRLRRALMRWTRADRAFLEIDHGARSDYEQRIAGLVDCATSNPAQGPGFAGDQTVVSVGEHR